MRAGLSKKFILSVSRVVSQLEMTGQARGGRAELTQRRHIDCEMVTPVEKCAHHASNKRRLRSRPPRE